MMQYVGPGQALSAPSGLGVEDARVAVPDSDQEAARRVEDNEGGIPSADRPQRIREAEGRIFGLEIAEEKFVMAALDAGLEVRRRIDASPWAILGYGLEEAVPPRRQSSSLGFGLSCQGRPLRRCPQQQRRTRGRFSLAGAAGFGKLAVQSALVAISKRMNPYAGSCRKGRAGCCRMQLGSVGNAMSEIETTFEKNQIAAVIRGGAEPSRATS